MGTGFVFQIEDDSGDQHLTELSAGALEVLEDANQRFSLYLDDSEISRLIRGELPWIKASIQQKSILEQVEAWREKTHGFFDSRAGSKDYDPSGLVKSWATQNAADYLSANGVSGFTINAGGDILLSPDLISPVLNRVGLSNLRSIAAEGSGANLILDLANTRFRAVATSGTSERGEHIWRRDKASELMQVSVVGTSLVEADIWATAIISGGRSAWEVFDATRGGNLVALATTTSGEIFSTRGFADLLARL